MPIHLNTEESLKSEAQLVSLVEAVFNAEPEEEHEALEWKSGYEDVTDKAPSFAIAKAILGFANRDVRTSKSNFGGEAYLIVGAEPGEIRGQKVPDSAELVQAIGRYTGPTAPAWRARQVQVREQNVLIITVAPPSDGDRIALLRKSFESEKGSFVNAGTVFVRKAGKTERATREDMDALQDRLLAGGNNEQLTLEQKKQRIRGAIVDYVCAAERWVQTIEVWVIGSSLDDWRSGDLSRLSTSESGRQLGQAMDTIHRRYKELSLDVSDPDIRSSLEACQDLFKNPEIPDSVWSDGPSDPQHRSVAYDHLNSIRGAVARLQEAAARSLTER